MNNNTSTPSPLTLADLPFLGPRTVRATTIHSGIAVPVGTPASEVARLCLAYAASWRVDAVTGELAAPPREGRTVGGRTHYAFSAVRAL